MPWYSIFNLYVAITRLYGDFKFWAIDESAETLYRMMQMPTENKVVIRFTSFLHLLHFGMSLVELARKGSL